MRYEVLYDKLLVERMPEEEERSGFEIPDAYREKQAIGTVIEVGAGRVCADGSLAALTVKPGDVVIFNTFAGAELPRKGFLILREDEILALVKEETKKLPRAV